MKKMKSSAEEAHITLEFANNGLIMRNENNEDDVALLTHKWEKPPIAEGGSEIDNERIYQALGRRFYEWLMKDVLYEHADEFVITGFDVKITAVCVGRERS